MSNHGCPKRGTRLRNYDCQGLHGDKSSRIISLARTETEFAMKLLTYGLAREGKTGLSAEKAREFTAPLCPDSTCGADWTLRKSQTRTVWSYPAARRLGSGDKATKPL